MVKGKTKRYILIQLQHTGNEMNQLEGAYIITRITRKAWKISRAHPFKK